ncbi:hypothetical protein ACI5KX_09280 [Erythrobacter sp. GH1-10]|uniref:hypothetical protein n=1 Tax=Erythrobacter sp. GH1-10 TaxID=3349334 RepID=UPI00387838D0
MASRDSAWYAATMTEPAYTELVDRAKRALKDADHFEAASLFHSAAVAAQQAGLANERAYALRHCAIAEIENANFEKALGDASEALGIYEASGGGGSLNAANTLRLVALAQEGVGEGDRSVENWQQARQIYEKHGIDEGVQECDAHLD